MGQYIVLLFQSCLVLIHSAGSTGSDLIDLTKDESRMSTPEFLHRPMSPLKPPANPPSPGQSDAVHDATLGNPYDKNTMFDFQTSANAGHAQLTPS